MTGEIGPPPLRRRSSAGSARRRRRRRLVRTWRNWLAGLSPRMQVGLAVIASALLVASVITLVAMVNGTPQAARSADDFDRNAYCAAMTVTSVDFDPADLAAGMPKAMTDARMAYQRLQALAPPNLEDEWDTILSDLTVLIARSKGTLDSAAQPLTAFKEAFTTIYEDYSKNCTNAEGVKSG